MRSHRDAEGSRRNRSPWSYARAALMVGVLVGLTACSSGGSPGQTATGSPSVQPSSSPGGPPGAAGTIAAVMGSQLEVQNPTFGQVTVMVTPQTTITQTVKVNPSDLAAGDCVVVGGEATANSQTSGPFTASTVRIASTSGTCTGQSDGSGGGGFFGGGFGNGTPFPRPSGTPFPQRSGFPFPTPSNGRIPRQAFGKVLSVSGSTVVVQAVDFRTGGTSSVTVTIGSSTAVTKVESASTSVLAVGKCVTAIGPADETGAITANSLSLSTPGPDGCSAGFGRPGGGFPGGFGPGSGGSSGG
jgi:hypothetical protein